MSGKGVVLRDVFPSDVDTYIRWMTHGEWREYDAPWESMHAFATAEKESEFRKRFLERCGNEPQDPRLRAVITTLGGEALGWVNRYSSKNPPDEWYVGICIAEDEYLNRGIGTQALSLWVDHLFASSDFHRLGLTTWSLNPRMMRVAEKVGFVHEGAQREVREWEGQRLDRVQYGMLRREWEVGR
jgi:RimJ/RimL family protein N-acetyltransferase